MIDREEASVKFDGSDVIESVKKRSELLEVNTRTHSRSNIQNNEVEDYSSHGNPIRTTNGTSN